MSPSKPAAKAATKAKSQSSAEKKSTAAKKSAAADALETVRVIPAPTVATSDLPMTALSKQVIELAAAVEHVVKDGSATLNPEAVQAMMAALCKVYSGHVEAGESYHVFSERNPVTATDVMVTSSALLKAANVAVFELGMWQSWTGR